MELNAGLEGNCRGPRMEFKGGLEGYCTEILMELIGVVMESCI